MLFEVRLAYTTESMKAMIASPDDREAFARKMVEQVNGRLVGWYACPPTQDGGGWDSLVIYDVPNPDTHFALLSVAQATGAFTRIRTNRLLTSEEFMQATRRASDIKGWRNPGRQ